MNLFSASLKTVTGSLPNRPAERLEQHQAAQASLALLELARDEIERLTAENQALRALLDPGLQGSPT